MGAGRNARRHTMFDLHRGRIISRRRARKEPHFYLWGHLTAVNDAMFSVLRLGERLHPELDAVFIAQPDRSVPLPPSTEIAKCWEGAHTELLSRFTTLSPNEWLERHGNVSAEEFERNPSRNRLAVRLSRTNHASYHLGQMMLAKPRTA